MISLDGLTALAPWLIGIWKIAGNYLNEKDLFGAALGEAVPLLKVQTAQTGIVDGCYVQILFLLLKKRRANSFVYLSFYFNVFQSSHNSSPYHNLVRNQTKQTNDIPKIAYNHLRQNKNLKGCILKHGSMAFGQHGPRWWEQERNGASVNCHKEDIFMTAEQLIETHDPWFPHH